MGAIWRYAQNYAMNDNSFDSNFGPSSVGAINLVSGQTGGAVTHFGGGTSASYPAGTVGAGVTVIGDFDAYLDDCGADAGGTNTGTTTLEMTSKNVGDLLNAKGVSWGWFQGGFRPTTASVNGSVAQCHDGRVPHEYPSVNPTVVVPNPVPPFLTGADIHTPATSPTNYDYVSHHEPFQFYASTRNPHHLPPSSVAAIGQQDQANHQYDTRDFFAALSSGHLPAVSFVKAPRRTTVIRATRIPRWSRYWLTQVINAIQQSKEWDSTAIIIAYDDSDGWYDHVTGPIVSPSQTSADVYSQPRLWQCRRRGAGHPGPLRLRPASAAAGDLALGERQLRRSHPDQPGVHPEVHRGQLEPGPHRRDRAAAGRGLLRPHLRFAAGAVQLRGAAVEAGGAADLLGRLRQEQA